MNHIDKLGSHGTTYADTVPIMNRQRGVRAAVSVLAISGALVLVTGCGGASTTDEGNASTTTPAAVSSPRVQPAAMPYTTSSARGFNEEVGRISCWEQFKCSAAQTLIRGMLKPVLTALEMEYQGDPYYQPVFQQANDIIAEIDAGSPSDMEHMKRVFAGVDTFRQLLVEKGLAPAK